MKNTLNEMDPIPQTQSAKTHARRNRPISIKEIEWINNLPKSARPRWVHWYIISNIQGRNYTSSLQFFQKTEAEGIFPIHSKRPALPACQNQMTSQERLIPLMNIAAKFLNKILANQCIRRIIHHNQVGSIFKNQLM